MVDTLVGPHLLGVDADEADPAVVIVADCAAVNDTGADDAGADDVIGADCVVVSGCEDSDVAVVESSPMLQTPVPTQTGTARFSTAEDSA